MYFLLFLYNLRLVAGALYDADDDVVELDSRNFVQAIQGQPHAWMVEFYASWCGHCQHFAPFYKRFASEIVDWRDTLRIGAIDCADTENEDTCLRYEIKGYPTIKYFPPNADQDEIGVFRESWDKSVASLKYDSIDFIQSVNDTNINDSNNNTKDSNNNIWPKLDPILGLDSVENGAGDTFIILEDQFSYLGREVLLNLHNGFIGSQNIVIYRMVIDENSSLDLNIRELPALGLYDKKSRNLSILRTNISGLEIERLVYSHFHEPFSGTQGEETSEDEDLEPSGEVSHQPADLTRRRYSVFLADLEKTVIQALLHEVPMQGEISGQKLTALRDFLSVLADFFPENSRILPLLTRLTTLPDRNIVDRLVEMVSKEEDWFENQPWVACKGSQPRYGGYPCGQWMLWHTLTVSQFNLKSGHPSQVMKAMGGYIQHFFSCRECAAHFTNMTEGGAVFNNINTYQESVMYLWRAHNQVTRRLMTAADPVYPKFFFPQRSQCPLCYRTAKSNSDRTAGDIDERRVFTFLLEMYGKPDTQRGARGLSSQSSTSLVDTILTIGSIIVNILI